MIDRKTREKIIRLKEEGCSNTEIKKRTNLSLPTIRKILREAGLVKARSSSLARNNIEDAFEGFDERLERVETAVMALTGSKVGQDRGYVIHDIILNFSRNLPLAWAEGNVWKALSNGVAYWLYEDYLEQVLDAEIVSTISRQLERYSPLPFKIFNVKVGVDTNGEYFADVKLLRYRL
ncbi:MAG: winged helix-turn-helix transcriptional regulator [Candidatus Bathyarchaeota archaeon]|nr:MAG: winged helix-turn-helix transcriptional regulator [Candidatus Bathyarchaeota archaeon]